MITRGLRVGLVGPLPPPSGGMANQTQQLARLLREEGVEVKLVRTNAEYRPAWVAPLRGVRALFRLIPFLVRLWTSASRVELFHVMANSGWAWHLFAAPAICIAKLRGVPVLVNYRGGNAEEFFSKSIFWAKFTMGLADRLVVPSGFLQKVFIRFDLHAEVVPNIVDLSRYAPRLATAGSRCEEPHIIVTRNLELIYDIGTALHAFALVRKARPRARMTIAGGGPEHHSLTKLAETLGVIDRVTFAGRLDSDQVAKLYACADLFLNSSVVDNMPNSILEALASGVPVVSTDVGGIPFLVENRKTALLVSPRDPSALAKALLELLDDRQLAERLASAGRASVQQYGWSSIRGRLFDVYSEMTRDVRPGATVQSK